MHMTVWAGVVTWRTVTLFFFDNNINTEQYVNVIETLLVPSLGTKCKLRSTWF